MKNFIRMAVLYVTVMLIMLFLMLEVVNLVATLYCDSDKVVACTTKEGMTTCASVNQCGMTKVIKSLNY